MNKIGEEEARGNKKSESVRVQLGVCESSESGSDEVGQKVQVHPNSKEDHLVVTG